MQDMLNLFNIPTENKRYIMNTFFSSLLYSFATRCTRDSKHSMQESSSRGKYVKERRIPVKNGREKECFRAPGERA